MTAWRCTNYQMPVEWAPVVYVVLFVVTILVSYIGRPKPKPKKEDKT